MVAVRRRSGSVLRASLRRSRRCRRRSPQQPPGSSARGRVAGLPAEAGWVTASHLPSGTRTAATARSNTCGPGTSSTRMTEPVMSTRARRPPVCLPPVQVQGAGDGDHVVEQVGRVDRRAGRAQDADLERQQQDCSGDPRRGRRRGDEVGRNDHGPDRPLVFPRRLQADDTHRITGDPDSAWQLPISRRHDPRRRG